MKIHLVLNGNWIETADISHEEYQRRYIIKYATTFPKDVDCDKDVQATIKQIIFGFRNDFVDKRGNFLYAVFVAEDSQVCVGPDNVLLLKEQKDEN